MMKRTLLLAAALLGLSAPAFAAGETPVPPQVKWTFQGPFGKFDRAQLQRGFKVYREVCASCHSLSYVYFRNLYEPGGPEFSEAQVKALAAEYKIQDGPNEAGDMFERAGRVADRFPSPFPNEQAAAAANGGKAPPDLSLMAKARTYERGFPWFVVDVFRQYSENGADYLTALLKGYEEPPAGFQVPAGGHYNRYYPGPHHRHAEAAQRRPGGVSQERGRPAAGAGDRGPILPRRDRLPRLDRGAAPRAAQAPRLPGHAVPARPGGPALLHQEEDLGPGGRRGRRTRHPADDPQSLIVDPEKAPAPGPFP
jgi:cytochrome c1